MELQFDKTAVQCLQTVIRELQTQEQTQEVRLPDHMPDVGRVLASWGQVIIRGKEWRGGGMSISGGIMVWTLYIPEDEEKPQSIESWLPLQMKWDFSAADRDGTICVMPMLQNVDARCISPRKLMLRAGVSMLGEATAPQQIEVFTPGELPSDVQVLQKTYPMRLPMEAGEKAFHLDSDLSLPTSALPLESIISNTVRTEVRETKVVGDKLVFRGALIVHLCYLTTDGSICHQEVEVAFSQYAQLDGEYPDDTCVSMVFVLSDLELRTTEDGDLTLHAGVVGQYMLYAQKMVSVAEDAYSPVRHISDSAVTLQMPAILEMRRDVLEIDKSVQTECVRIADVSLYPEPPRVRWDGQRMIVELACAVQMLGYDADGGMQATSSVWEGEWAVEGAPGIVAELRLQPPDTATVTAKGDCVDLHASMVMDVVVQHESDIPMLTGLDIGEVVKPNPDRPGIILRRAGTESLWQIAKKAGSTVEAIQKANHLQDEPDSRQMLLIPIL